MDIKEIYYMLEKPTLLEIFFSECHNKWEKPLSFLVDNSTIENLPEISPGVLLGLYNTYHTYSWDTDEIILAHMGIGRDHQFFPDRKTSFSLGKNVFLFRIPRFLNINNAVFEIFSLYYVMKGTYTIRIDNKALFLEEGNVVIVPPDVGFCSDAVGFDDIILHIIVPKDVIYNYFYNIAYCNDEMAYFFSKEGYEAGNSRYLLVRAESNLKLRVLALEMLAEQDKMCTYSEKIIISSIKLFINHLLSDYAECIEIRVKLADSDRIVMMIINYMRDNFTDLSIERLSQHFSKSASYITRLLKQKTGKNYMQMLTQIRLEKAKELLSTSNLCVEDITKAAGYSCTRQFRRAFAELFGITPSEFRKEKRE